MTTRQIQTACGPMLVPAHPEERSRRSEECVREVLDTQIYSYPRDRPEDVSVLLDVGHNVGAWTIWACNKWWPGQIKCVHAFDPNASAVRIAVQNTSAASTGWRVIGKRAAVTIDPAPLFLEETDWGGSRTYGQSTGVAVPVVHPRDLPPADVLKCDAEGVEVEVLNWYRHWDRLKVVMFEYHETRFRKALMAICKANGFEMRRGNPNVCEVDTQCWVRP